MSALADQQRALLDALFVWPSSDASRALLVQARGVGSRAERGLKAYQSNGHMLAERALRAAYPVLAQMLGDESFGDLARALWHAHPPQCGDIARWGEATADFVQVSEQLQGEPYLVDVARAEWALHRCAFAQDQDADLASLALLTTDDPQTLTLVLAPGLATLSSLWPLASLLLAHTEGSPSFAEVGAQLSSRIAQAVVIWRHGFQPRLRLPLAGELPVLCALQTGRDLASALQASTELDIAQWLPLAVRTGLVLGVCPHVAPSVALDGGNTGCAASPAQPLGSDVCSPGILSLRGDQIA
ncbi:DNA-binding domain-containing protein [Rhodoferax lacus]|uniref:HvfC/BufC N-terminal domain-containing protein n=1 Tax=Rhodoferax lacus TaxID=2184758 RepID=UPI001314F7B4|nr:DNA-binding domain-containing protein [Rhodoferax lacus]